MRTSWLWCLVPVFLLALLVTAPVRADSKDKKPGKGENSEQERVRRLLEELASLQKSKTDDKPKGKKEDKKDEDKGKGKGKKKDEDKDKGKKKGRIVQVDLDKLPPGLAKQVLKYAESAKKGEKKEEEKKKDKKKGKKKDKKEDDDDD